MSFRKQLTDRATIERRLPIPTVDDYGIETMEYTWGVIATDVPCYLSRNKHDLIQSPSYQTLAERWDVVFLPSVDIRATDRIVIDDMELIAGKPQKVKRHHLDVPCTQEIAL